MSTTEANGVPEQCTAGPVPEGYKVITEGKGSILEFKNDAFYNPAQVVNRDLSVAVLRQYIKLRQADIASGKLKIRPAKRPRLADGEGGDSISDETAVTTKAGAESQEEAQKGAEGIKILEGLAASGLRAIRYALEVEGAARIDANDIDPKSVAAIQRNVAYNGAQASQRVHATQNDARVLMIQQPGSYDAVDLDPYGSPVQLLDSAVQAVSEGGLLMVTATDMGVLCGVQGEACWAKYGSYPLHRSYCHEMALRILLASINSHAARYKRCIVPLLSLSIDFYVRVFVRVYTSAVEVKDAATKLMNVYQSSGCDSFYTQPVGRKEVKGKQVKHHPGRPLMDPQKCRETGSGFIMGGPYWAGPLHDSAFVTELLASIEASPEGLQSETRLKSLLTLALEELPDVPLYYTVHDLCKLLKTVAPPQDTFRSALVNAGFRVSSTHAKALAVKTDAPPEVIWDIMRAWVKKSGGNSKGPSPNSYGAAILSKEPAIEVDFSRNTAAASASRASKALRFPLNPEANWGPKRRHTRQVEDAAVVKKSKLTGLEEEEP